MTLRGLVSPLREVLPGRIEVGTRLLAQGREGEWMLRKQAEACCVLSSGDEGNGKGC